MSRLSVFCGVLLVILGIVGGMLSLQAETKSYTRFIPAVLGLLLIIFGILSNRGMKARMICMHLAPLVALAGIFGSLIPGGGLNFSEKGMSSTFKLLTAIVCLYFFVMCIRSFIAARKSRGA